MPDMRRTIKDSVFTYLFSQPEYTKKLYLALHPEDISVSENDIKLVTLENVLSVGQYNDLGIQVGDKLLLLMEAQSTFSINLALRMLLYVAETYKQYVEEHNLDLYSTKPVTIPRPELYVVYTGEHSDIPDVLTLASLYNGEGSVDVTIKVLRDGESDNILAQYVQFCKISDKQRKIHGATQQAINETLRICEDKNVLVPFLTSRKKEVENIMVNLYDQQKILEVHDFNVRKEAKAEGRAEANEKGIQILIKTLRGVLPPQDNLVEEIAKHLMANYGLSADEARAKTEQYLLKN